MNSLPTPDNGLNSLLIVMLPVTPEQIFFRHKINALIFPPQNSNYSIPKNLFKHIEQQLPNRIQVHVQTHIRQVHSIGNLSHISRRKNRRSVERQQKCCEPIRDCMASRVVFFWLRINCILSTTSCILSFGILTTISAESNSNPKYTSTCNGPSIFPYCFRNPF